MLSDLRIEMLPTAKLAPYAANARQHPEAQVHQLAASIREFGFNVPVLVDDAGVLIAGHGRVLAAKALGLSSIPAIRLGHLTEAQAKAYRLADNQLALNSTWDDGLLATELRGLLDAEFDLGLIGFDAMTLDRLLAGPADEQTGSPDPDAPAPAPPAAPVSHPGDLWILGRHRLLCGDATNPQDVARLLDGAKPHLMASDPPYGVEYDPSWRNEAGVSATARTGKVANDDRADWREAWALFPGDVAYVWHAGVHARTVIESLEAAGFAIRSQIIWAKPRFVLGRGDYHWQHEPCLYAVRKGATGHWQGARDQATLWSIGFGGDEDAETIHGTQKPVECMRRPIVNNTAVGDAVYEPFSGKAMAIADDTTGGYLAPSEYVREIIKGVTEMSPVRALARVRGTSSKSIMLPKRTGQFAARRVSEQGTRTETPGLAYGMIEITAPEVYALVDISQHNLEDSAYDLESEIRAEAVEQFAVKEGQEFVGGSGVGEAEGILTNADIAFTPSGSAATIADAEGQGNGLITLFHALKTAYARNAVWTLNRVTLGSVRKLKDADKNYVWMPGLANGVPNTILGAPYVECPDMPNEGADAFPIAFGDFRRGYVIVDRIAMTMLRDPFTQATSGNVRFLFRRRMGGAVVLAESMRKLKCAAA